MSKENLFFEEAKKIHDKLKEEKSKSSEFNIFTILNKETDEESTHCRFIYELLSPDGSHNQGDRFLKLFFEKVIGDEYPAEYAVVRREVCLTDESRLDLMIDTDNCCYLIEAKINAGEQYRQIERYCQWAEKRNKDYKMYFLTLDGHKAKTAGEYDCFHISFKSEIFHWLGECKKGINIPTLTGAIEQYLQLLNKLTSKETQTMSEFNTLIKNNIKIAQDISRQLPIVKGKMIEQVLREIESYIQDKYGLKSIPNVEDYYVNKYENYYVNHSNGRNPRISFKLSSEENSKNLYFLSIIVDYSLFIGCDILCIDNESGHYIPCVINNIELDKKYLFGRKTKNLYWYWWKYLEYNGENINFYEQNENFYKLFDEKEYPEILERIKKQIDEIITQLKEQCAV